MFPKVIGRAEIAPHAKWFQCPLVEVHERTFQHDLSALIEIKHSNIAVRAKHLIF